MVFKKTVLCNLFVLAAVLQLATATPLDDFVNAPDPLFSYHLLNTIRGTDLGIGYTTYMYNMTATAWLTPQDSSRPVWSNWVLVTVPDNLDKSFETAMVFITDGSDTSTYTAPDPILLGISLSTGAVGVEVHQIPNEPIYFYPEGKRRTEDAIIAYTWKHFLDNPDQPYWLLRMPMTKCVVKAMDLTQQVTAKMGLSINSFVVGGASKRGWTTWTTAAVDKRVIAAIPIVMPLVKMQENLNLHYRTFGGWSFALDDYTAMNVTHYLNDPVFGQMAAIIDPWAYKDRFAERKMPMYAIASSGDEFFIPDSLGLFLDQMGNPLQFARLLPNAEHSCAGHVGDLIFSIATWFHHGILMKKAYPVWTYNVAEDKSQITVIFDKASIKPTYVKIWRANNFLKRDFRLITSTNPLVVNPIFWLEEELAPQADGLTYIATTTKPSNGWEGFFIELMFDVGGPQVLGEHFLRFTTPAAIWPDVYPFPPCTTDCSMHH
eukprot:ANDGO_02264.mRNA.1 Autocrine proliferation repressor protein A